MDKITFSFDKANLAKAKAIIKKYPENRERSALIPLLDLAQRQNKGWLSVEAMEYVADMLSSPYMRVYEVASFYSMFNLKPVGKYHVQICGTTPCWLRGAEDIKKACESHMKIKSGETTKDGKFTLSEVECLGACVNAPLVQINDDYYENLTPDSMSDLLEKLK
ncbi:MAG UNVERIFIED_CONTAM: NADH-quinone oxidoreductase subunit NuoE [Rickettsiaceae bacterium]